MSASMSIKKTAAFLTALTLISMGPALGWGTAQARCATLSCCKSVYRSNLASIAREFNKRIAYCKALYNRTKAQLAATPRIKVRQRQLLAQKLRQIAAKCNSLMRQRNVRRTQAGRAYRTCISQLPRRR